MLLLSFTPTRDLFKPGLYVEHPTVRAYVYTMGQDNPFVRYFWQQINQQPRGGRVGDGCGGGGGGARLLRDGPHELPIPPVGAPAPSPVPERYARRSFPSNTTHVTRGAGAC